MQDKNESILNINKKSEIENPQFSILMANYNNASYIEESIESVLNQTNEEWELIIIDDMSTDRSIDIIKHFLKDTRIHFYQNQYNVGYIGTLRRLIAKASSNIIGILDSDDTLEKSTVEDILIAYQENKKCGFVYTQFMHCNADMKPLYQGFCAKIPEGKSNLQCDCISAFRTFKKDIYYQTEGYNDEYLYAEDKDIAFKLEEITQPVFLSKPLYNYRVLKDSQGHHPTKSRIGRLSFIKVRCDAYIRRKNMNIPNLNYMELTKEFFLGVKICIKLKDLERTKMLINNFVKVLLSK